VTVKGSRAIKATTLVAPEEPIHLEEGVKRFASRGGVKLDRALARLSMQVKDRKWLDAGASTGGFTDRLMEGGAGEVVAVDVGYGQLDWKLRDDPKITILDRTNVRHLTPDDLPWIPDGITADLSFISLTLVLPALASIASEDADLLLLVKPQFEVGKNEVGRSGVVRDPSLWRYAISKVVVAAEQLGFGLVTAVPSELAGPAGNREFFVHLRRDASSDTKAIDRAVAEAAEAEETR
jgi:23S rRNA (cytidine1920-2'-O)/16S rRNA (cytidine1409-2'-O)-methyltransferase